MASVTVSQDTYNAILDKQMEIFSKHRKRVELKMIANAAIKHGMIKVDEELGFTNNTK